MLGTPRVNVRIDKRPMHTYYDVADLLMDHGYIPHPASVGRVKEFMDKNNRFPSADELAKMDLPTYKEHQQ